MLPKAEVRNVGITIAGPEAIAAELDGHLRSGSKAPASLVAVNVHTFVESCRSKEFREALADASVAWIDGVPIRWLLRARGIVPPERIHGADLMTLLLDRLRGARHLFYGSTPDTLDLLKANLSCRFPDLKTVGFISPPFRKEAIQESDATLELLNSTGADVLWVALGAPKQERWALLNRHALRIPIVACVGAAFEIHAGRFERAPVFFQRLALEWAWRLTQDPARLWRRYFSTNGYFLTLLLRELGRRPSERPS